MPRRWMFLAAAALLPACGGGDESSLGGQAAPATVSRIEGVETFAVEAAHTEAPVSYPQVPPVGGAHNPTWQRCGPSAEPVQDEKAVHSLEHGAIWITYRPDLPAADVATLATLARSRNLVLVSPWVDDGLPTPVVATAWGVQLRLESVSDPRLREFVRLYANKGPEVDAPC